MQPQAAVGRKAVVEGRQQGRGRSCWGWFCTDPGKAQLSPDPGTKGDEAAAGRSEVFVIILKPAFSKPL